MSRASDCEAVAIGCNLYLYCSRSSLRLDRTSQCPCSSCRNTCRHSGVPDTAGSPPKSRGLRQRRQRLQRRPLRRCRRPRRLRPRCRTAVGSGTRLGAPGLLARDVRCGATCRQCCVRFLGLVFDRISSPPRHKTNTARMITCLSSTVSKRKQNVAVEPFLFANMCPCLLWSQWTVCRDSHLLRAE